MLRRGLISVLLALVALGAAAQTRVQADAEVKTLSGGKVTTVTKRVFCSGNGRVVTVNFTPYEYYSISTLKGEMKIYLPSSNEVATRIDENFSTKDNLLYLFLSGHQGDLGLVSLGYRLSSSGYDPEGYLKRTYTTSSVSAPANVDVVLKDYLPIYVEYRDASGIIVGKTYLSSYDYSSSVPIPSRVTEIHFNKEKKDSVITRTIYSSIIFDGTAPEFDYQVPAGAKPVANPLDAIKK